MVVQDNRTDMVTSSLKNDKKHRLKQRFDVQRKLGQGTYGKVQLAVNRESGMEVAVKTIKKVKIESEQDLIRIRREIQIMSSIQHPHIIHIYEVFENKDKIVLVMQFASGGELYDYLSEKKILSDLEARRIFRQISAAVYYCHKNKICHRDLKLENILLDEKGNAKIADFGLSNVFDEKHLLKTYCGSPLYASPEIVKGVPYYGPEVDCWSMGVLLYTLVYGAMPFDGSNFKKLVTQISEGDYFEPKKKSNASELIRKLLTVNPNKRATIVDICMDYWVNVGYEHSLLQVAEDMANLTPVRLDLLLALAPGSPIPEADSEFQEQSEEGGLPLDSDDKDIPDDDEEDDDYNPDTAANSFAFMKGSHASQLSLSSPNLQEAIENLSFEDADEFLPADVAAALQGDGTKRLAERSFGASLARISSLAHRSKKPRKSDSSNTAAEIEPTSEQSDPKAQVSNTESDKASANENEQKPTLSLDDKKSADLKTANINAPKSKSCEVVGNRTNENDDWQKQHSDEQIVKPPIRKESLSSLKFQEALYLNQKRESLTPQDEKKIGRPPGKIIIPKTFDSPQQLPATSVNKTPRNSISEAAGYSAPSETNVKKPEEMTNDTSSKVTSHKEDVNKNVIPDTPPTPESPAIMEEKKNIAKGILKKGIAKAKLVERRMSQQSSFDSEVSTPPASLVGTPEPKPSFFKTPKPYVKEEEKSMKSKAEIKLSSNQNSSSTLKGETMSGQNAPLWAAAGHSNDGQLQDRNLNWSAISSTIDSEMSGWRDQMEESLRRLTPEDERSSNQAFALSKVEDDKPLVPIARSYKKFTFTKDGACITETKKIYTTPGADGSWTKVEKKTKITTRPGNAEEFEKFRDMHLRNESALTKSDSQSSSGSNEVYDDLFDSWTGDTMMCNMRKMNNMFQKFSRDPFLRKERRKNPFRFFRRTESERNERERRKYEPRSSRFNDVGSSDNEEDYDVHFDDSNAVVYGSQGLWQLLRSANRGFPGRVTIQHEPTSYGRSLSQDRSEWKRCGSRTSSGYNTGTRSQSRDRTESPREKVLRFVFESPQEPSRPMRRSTPRRDSGVGSDGYESEYSIRPSDELSKTGRVSSMSSICSSGRQDMIRNFMRSWSKEFATSPFRSSQLENLPENRKHRVEQWLDMNPDVPFDLSEGSHPRVNSRKSTSSHSSAPHSGMYPREYLRYNRSSSDKLADYDSKYFPAFGETYRVRSHSLNKEDSLGDVNKSRFRSSAYSPVSEESKESVRHSDSSHSASSVHHINFTFSDGRITSSHTSPKPATNYVRTFSNSKEDVTARNPTPPVVQMRVSFNRGNQENQVIHVTSQPSPKGLWEQQDASKPVRQEFSPANREVSPLPGIRQFSTEVQHSVGGSEQRSRTSLECELTNSGNESPQTGKNSPYKHSLESSIWDMACSQPCMNSELTNTDTRSEILPNSIHSTPPKPFCFKTEFNGIPQTVANGANTPDSLEDLSLEQSLSECSNPAENNYSNQLHLKENQFESPSRTSQELRVEVKPLGVLWNSCDANMSEIKYNKAEPEFAQTGPFYDEPTVDTTHCLKKYSEDSGEFGSIWNQKSANQTFDILKNLLADDGLESFSSTKCFIGSSRTESNRNDCTKHTDTIRPVIEKNISVIDNIELDDIAHDKFHKIMPTLMDDLQSPKEVLRQAMKICESLENFK